MAERHLFTYIKSVKEGLKSPEIVDCQFEEYSFSEDGIEVTAYCKTYYFSDGVVLRYDFEQEHAEHDAGLCPECWIAYKVIYAPADIDVSPVSKSFINPCQEAFWLKMTQMHHQNTSRISQAG